MDWVEFTKKKKEKKITEGIGMGLIIIISGIVLFSHHCFIFFIMVRLI